MLFLTLFTLLLSTSSLAQSSSQTTFQAPPSIPRSQFKLTSLSRSIELGGATSKATTVYSLRPSTSSTGGSSEDESVFVFALDAKEAAILSWIEAYTGRTGNTKKSVKVERLASPSGGG